MIVCPVCQQEFAASSQLSIMAGDLLGLPVFVEHLSEHVANLAARARPVFECPIHPGAGVTIHSDGQRVLRRTCNWVQRDSEHTEWCEETPVEVPI